MSSINKAKYKILLEINTALSNRRKIPFQEPRNISEKQIVNSRGKCFRWCKHPEYEDPGFESRWWIFPLKRFLSKRFSPAAASSYTERTTFCHESTRFNILYIRDLISLTILLFIVSISLYFVTFSESKSEHFFKIKLHLFFSFFHFLIVSTYKNGVSVFINKITYHRDTLIASNLETFSVYFRLSFFLNFYNPKLSKITLEIVSSITLVVVALNSSVTSFGFLFKQFTFKW